jgi:hypothetical protein
MAEHEIPTGGRDMIPQGAPVDGLHGGYEASDANVRSVVWSMALILGSSAVIVALLIPMFRYFEGRENAKDAKIPDVYAQEVIPPKPRLLPSPVDETETKLSLGAGADYAKAPFRRAESPVREARDYTTDNLLPWDKFMAEATVEEIQANSYTREKDGTYTIPIERAMEVVTNEPPAYKPKYVPPKPADAHGAHGDQSHGDKASGDSHASEKPGAHGKTQAEATGARQAKLPRTGDLTAGLPNYYGPVYSENARWEGDYHKYSADSSGGLAVNPVGDTASKKSPNQVQAAQ